MIAIYKKEIKSYFTSMTGYLFIAFILFAIGIYFTAYNLRGASTAFGYVLYAVTFVFLILIPVLTMRILAEERKMKTDQLLYTAPVSMKAVITGKYLALLTIFMIPMILVSFYPVIMSRFGTVSFAVSYASILGFVLLGAAYLSIGLFISSLTENQVIAAVGCFGFLLITFLIQGITGFLSSSSLTSYLGFTIALIIASVIVYIMIKNAIIALAAGIIGEIILTTAYIIKPTLFEGALAKVLNSLDLASKFTNFVSGIFDITGIIYYLSVIILCLFLTMQSIQKRRWS